MSFPERRYELQGACDPIFGIRPTLEVDPNAWMPIIPNIGSRCSWWVNCQHIAFQKITCPSGRKKQADAGGNGAIVRSRHLNSETSKP